MRHGLSIPPFLPPQDLVHAASEAEAAGWDGIFLWDHLRWSRPVDVFDPWTLLGAIAQATNRITLGTMVTPLTRRRPWVVARQLVTLDHLSVGRAVLGVGLGAPQQEDFADLGEVTDPRARGQLLDESLDLVAGSLGGPVSHHGDTYRVRADWRPGPVQQPRPPIWVGGMLPNRRPLERALRWDGYVPIAADAPVTPQALADVLKGHDRPEHWDLVVQPAPGIPVQEYASIGVTWLIREVPVTDDLARAVLVTAAAGPEGETRG